MLHGEDIRTIVGIVGNVVSMFLFLSPLPTFIKIGKAKSVQAYKPDPYLATVLNCGMWIFYSLPFVHPDSLLVLTINSMGLSIELIYVIVFFIFANWDKRRKIIMALFIEIIFLTIVILITMIFFHTTKSRSMIVGIVCVVFNIIMYTAPLTVMRLVIRTKSVKYMPFGLSLCNFLNGFIWLVYALIKFDPYILIPNSLGTASGLIQLILYGTYYRTTTWEDDSKPAEVQLPASANNT
ncbi:hypothetical protein LguiA_028132 [Lonicera macranthoides]